MPDICTKEYICAGDDRIATWEADPNSTKTLYNWQQKLDLTCVDDWKIGMIGASLFIGWCVTLLWLPSIADKKGRRNLFWFGMVCDLALYTGLMLTHRLGVMIFIYFCFGMICSIRIQVGYVYLMEVLPKKAQTHVTSGWNVQEAMIYVVGTIYFWKISKHWFWYCLIGYIWQAISVIFLIWMPESPRYLISVGKLDEAKKVFQTIAWWNKKSLEWDERLYSKNGLPLKRPVVMCSQDSESQVKVLEIIGLPLRVTTTSLKTWLETQVGAELVNEIKHVGLMTDVESQNIRASRSTGILLRASKENALSLNCYLGFDS